MGLQPGDPQTGLPLGLRWVSIGHAARKQEVHYRAQASPTRDTSRSTWTTDGVTSQHKPNARDTLMQTHGAE